jgi:hypothetical protein
MVLPWPDEDTADGFVSRDTMEQAKQPCVACGEYHRMLLVEMVVECQPYLFNCRGYCPFTEDWYLFSCSPIADDVNISWQLPTILELEPIRETFIMDVIRQDLQQLFDQRIALFEQKCFQQFPAK